jgi:hypothetical protein
MARRTKRRRDDTWIVKEDEYHPNPKVAAVAADENARESALKANRQELDRAEVRRAKATTASETRAAHEETKRLKDERDRINKDIIDAAKEKEATGA